MDKAELIQEVATEVAPSGTEGFVDSYKTFTNVLNRLRRQYLELKDESQRQAKALEEANESLQALTLRNHAAMEFLNSVLGSVSTGIVVVDKDKKITHLNPAAETLFDVQATETLGASFAEVTKFRASIGASDDQSASRGSSITQSIMSAQSRGVERTFMNADGEEKTYLWGSSPLLDKQGESFGSVEAFEDITAIKLMERKMTRMESLAAIGEMAATVAHQVRNPLVSVKGFASLINAQPAKGSKNKAHAELILRGVSNLERVIDALLRFSRNESLSLRSTNLNRYLKKVVRQYNDRMYDQENNSVLESQNGAPASVVSVTTADNRVAVDIDQLVFREAIVNIIRNAHEASSGPVECEVIIENPVQDAKYVSFKIRDNGPGIPAEVARDIFRPFFTTKASGSGLGLALGKKLVNAHGGEITVDSKIGVGTTFCIKLPLSTALENESGEKSTDTSEQN